MPTPHRHPFTWKILASLIVFVTGCTTMSPLPAPDSTWTTRKGVMHYTHGTNHWIGRCTVSWGKGRDFHLDYRQLNGDRIIEVWISGQNGRATGQFEDGTWEGDVLVAPPALQPWLEIPVKVRTDSTHDRIIFYNMDSDERFDFILRDDPALLGAPTPNPILGNHHYLF